MKQMTITASNGFELHGRATLKGLGADECVLPCAKLCVVIEPDHLRAGNGRAPIWLERIFRTYPLVNRSNQADDACEGALHFLPAFRDCCPIDLGRKQAPYATTPMKFRHPLEAHKLGVALFAYIGELLHFNGTRLSGDTIVDATFVTVPLCQE
jgi:transposase, IS5 family